jgi:hypothetical protein
VRLFPPFGWPQKGKAQEVLAHPGDGAVNASVAMTRAATTGFALMQLRRCLNVNVAFKNRVIVDDKSVVVDYTLSIDAEEILLQSLHCSGRDRR